MQLASDVAFAAHQRLGTHDNKTFGTQPHGPHARCLRFVITVARVHPTITQDSLPAWRSRIVAGGTFTLGCDLKFWFATTSSSARLVLAHGAALLRRTRMRAIAIAYDAGARLVERSDVTLRVAVSAAVSRRGIA